MPRKPEPTAEKPVWAVRKSDGPHVFVGDLVVKLLAKHHVRARLHITDDWNEWPELVTVKPQGSASRSFFLRVGEAVAIVGRRFRIDVGEKAGALNLPAGCWINTAGNLRLPPQGKLWSAPELSDEVVVNLRRPELERGYAYRVR